MNILQKIKDAIFRDNVIREEPETVEPVFRTPNDETFDEKWARYKRQAQELNDRQRDRIQKDSARSIRAEAIEDKKEDIA